MRLKVGILLIGQRHLGGGVHLLLVLEKNGLVDLDLWGSKGGCGDKLELSVADELPCEPEERLLEVVVGLGRDVVVLEVLLAVESDGLGLDLALLNINLVTCEDDWDVLADTDKVTVPVGDVLVGDAGSDVEHDDTALAVDVVTISETTELLLSCGVPHVKLDVTQVGSEGERVDLNTEGRNVLLLELSSQVTLDESGLSGTTVTNEDELEGRSLGHGCVVFGLKERLVEKRLLMRAQSVGGDVATTNLM